MEMLFWHFSKYFLFKINCVGVFIFISPAGRLTHYVHCFVLILKDQESKSSKELATH